MRRYGYRLWLVCLTLALAGVAVYLLASTRSNARSESCGAGDTQHVASHGTAACSTGSGNVDVYVAQTEAGSGDGSSCGNARPASFFNAASNWGAGKPIEPGTVIGLCGTVTSTLTFQGDGTSGNPITLFFEPGSKVSQPVCSPCIDVSNRSWITIDGGGTPKTRGNGAGLSATQGVVESNDNGSDRGHHANALGISVSSSSHLTIKNLVIRDMYVHTRPDDCKNSDGVTGCTVYPYSSIYSIFGTGSFWTIAHDVFHDSAWNVYYNGGGAGVGQDIHIDHNEMYNFDHGLSESGGDVGNLWFNNNWLHDMKNFDTLDNTFHHTAVHCYTIPVGATHHIDNWYAYDNRFGPNPGGNDTSWFWTPRSGTGNAGCMDDTSQMWFFNNVCVANTHIYDGCVNLDSGTQHIWNNTLVGGGRTTSQGNVCSFDFAVAGADMRNNICANNDQIVGILAPPAWAAGAPDHDLYANGNSFYCNGWLTFSQFTKFKTCLGGAGEAHGLAVRDAKLDTNQAPRKGSPALHNGANLTTRCTGNLIPLCSDINGNRRPPTGHWTIGATN